MPSTSRAEDSTTQASAANPRLVATFFSFPVMCMFLLAGAIFAYCGRGIAESDIWWHMRNARALLQYHSLSRTDTYSFTAFGSPWINFEWLSELPFFLAFKAMGLRGLLLVYFTVLVLIYAVVYYRCCRAGADCKDAVIATLGAICLGGVSMAPRTLLFGWLCMVGLLLVIDRFQNTGKGLWLLPPLFALWINLHGSWVFGIIVLLLVIVSGLIEGQWGLVTAHRWSSVALRKLLLAFATCLAALFINPYGYQLVTYPFKLLSRPQGVVQYIDEWQPVDFSNWNGRLALILIFGLLAVSLFSSRRWRLDQVLLVAFALSVCTTTCALLILCGANNRTDTGSQPETLFPLRTGARQALPQCGNYGRSHCIDDLTLPLEHRTRAKYRCCLSPRCAGVHAASFHQWTTLRSVCVGRLYRMECSNAQDLY